MKTIRAFKSLFLFCLIGLSHASGAQAQGSISVNSVDGETAPGYLVTGQPISFNLRFTNNSPDNIVGSFNGFRIYSPDGANWVTTVGTKEDELTWFSFYDGGFFVNGFSITGMDADTIGFGGFQQDSSGVPSGYDDIFAHITIGPLSSADDGKTICIDSSFYRPSNAWGWATDTSIIFPDWSGPHCFTICTRGVTLDFPAGSRPSIQEVTSFDWSSNCMGSFFKIAMANDTALTDIFWTRELTATTVEYDGPILTPEQIYYWSVKEYENENSSFGPYHSSHSFFLLAPLDTLLAPNLIFPGDGDSIALPETFSWSLVTGNKKYQVKVLNSDKSNVVFSGETNSENLFMPDLPVFEPDSTFFWRVAAVDSSNFIGFWSTDFEFTIKSIVFPPSAPTNLKPDSTVTGFIGFSWGLVTGAGSYDLQFSIDPAYATPAGTFLLEGIPDTTHTINRSTTQTTYWRVRACNSAGCSGWTDGTAVGPELLACLTNAVINVNSDQFDVDENDLLSLTATLGGNCIDGVTGKWFVDAVEVSSFAFDTLDVSAVVASPILSTDVPGTYSVQVIAVANLDTVLSQIVDYTVNAVVENPAYQLKISASESSVPTNGGVSVIEVEVQDNLGNRLYSDAGRTIDFTLTGTGSLNSTTETSSDGLVSVDYTSSTTAETIKILAESSGLISDSLEIIVYPNDLILMKEYFLALMPVLEDLRLHFISGNPSLSSQYSTTPIYDFYNNKIDIGSPTTTDTSSFRRLLASLDIVLQNYYHSTFQLHPYDNDFTNTYSQEANWNDNVKNLQQLLTPLLNVSEIGYSLLHQLPDVQIGTLTLEDIARDNLRSLSQRGGNLINNVAASKASEFSRLGLQNIYENVLIDTKDSLDDGSLPSDVISNEGIRKAASDRALSEYVIASDPDLLNLVTLAENGTFTGDFTTLMAEVADILAIFKANGEITSSQLQSLDLISESSYYLGLLNSLPQDISQQFALVIDIGNQILLNEKYSDALELSTEYGGNLQIGLAAFAEKPFGNPAIIPIGETEESLLISNKQALKHFTLTPVDKELHASRLAAVKIEIDNYEILVRGGTTLLKAVQTSETVPEFEQQAITAVTAIVDSDNSLTQTFTNLQGTIYSISYTASSTVPEFESSYNSMSSSLSSSAQVRDLFNFYMTFAFADTSNAEAVDLAISYGNLALATTENSEDEISSLFSTTFSVSAAPAVMVSSVEYTVPEFDTPPPLGPSLFSPSGLDTAFVISFWVLNNGSGNAENGFVKAISDKQTTLSIADSSIDIGTLAAGDSVLVEFEAVFDPDAIDFEKGYAWSVINVVPVLSNGISVPTTLVIDIILGCCDKPGDFTGDGQLNIVDLTSTVSWLFKDGAGPACPEDADVNDDCALNIQDLTYRVNFFFKGGAALKCGCVGLGL